LRGIKLQKQTTE